MKDYEASLSSQMLNLVSCKEARAISIKSGVNSLSFCFS